MRRYAVLSLFSGIGAFDFGLEATGWFRTVAFVEVDEACQAVLRQQFPGVPIFGDVREVTADALRAAGIVRIDCAAGGFPCQPHSNAGRKRGRADDRHLWPEFARIIREVRPAWVIGENVPGIRTTAADEVLGDLEAAGYAAGAFVVGARHVGARHRRDRVWFVGHAEGGGWRERGDALVARSGGHPDGSGQDVADADDDRLAFREGFGRHLLAQLEAAHGSGRGVVWPRGERAESGLGRDPDGSAAGVDEGDIEFPTPSASRYDSNVGGAAGRVGPERLSLDSMASRGLWPTPAANGSVSGATMEAAAKEAARLHPQGRWTLATKMAEAEGFTDAPRSFPVEAWERDVPRVIPRGQPGRTTRLQQLGNAVVWLIPYAIGNAIAAYDLERAA